MSGTYAAYVGGGVILLTVDDDEFEIDADEARDLIARLTRAIEDNEESNYSKGSR